MLELVKEADHDFIETLRVVGEPIEVEYSAEQAAKIFIFDEVKYNKRVQFAILDMGSVASSEY